MLSWLGEIGECCNDFEVISHSTTEPSGGEKHRHDARRRCESFR